MKNAFFLIAIIVFQACSLKKTNQQSNINSEQIKVINMPEKYNYVSNISSVFRQVEYIPLETSKECHLVMPLKAAFHNNHFFILDFLRGLYVFDQMGNYSHQIGKIGRGPGEFIEIRDFDFDEKGNVLILDYKRILRYSPDGKYLDKYLGFDFATNDFFCNPYQFVFVQPLSFYIWGGTMGIEKEAKDHFAMYKMDDSKLVKNYFPLKYKLEDKQHRFLRCGAEILINPVVGNDTIYSIINGDLFAKYFVKFKHGADAKTIPNKLNSLSDFGLDLLNSRDISHNMSNPLETQNWLSFEFTYRRNSVITLFNKRNNKIYTIKSYGIDQKKSEKLMHYTFDFMYDDSFCSMVSASEFLTIEKGMNNPKVSIDFINVYDKLVNANDNHVILKYKPF